MKILCVRLSAIGDLVVTTPVYRALARQLGAEVHALTNRVPAQVLAHNPHVARIHDYAASDVVERLRAERFDLLVDLHCNLRSHRLRLRLGLPALGYRKRNLEKRLLSHGVDVLGDEHLVDRYFRALAPLGVHDDGEGLDYFLHADDWPAADHPSAARLARLRTRPHAAIVLAATHSTKRMPPELVADLLGALPVPAALLGAADVRGLADEVLALSGRDDTVDLVDALPLRASIAVLAEAAGVISPDTGLMHAAAALRRPLVVVWGNTAPPYGMYPYLPAAQRQLAAYAQVEGLDCRPCSRIGYPACPRGHFACMRRQTGASIAEAFARVTASAIASAQR